MKKIYLFLSTFVLINLSLALFSQKAPMKFGKVDLQDLQMNFYPADSSASAVVLCNYGYFNASKFEFVHQIRIKILKEEGKEWGNFYVPAAEKTNVRGQTINLENGQPVVSKLGKDGVFIERVTRDVYNARVAMPNVKVGAVLDVEFFYSGLPSYWNFQETIPVKWSELILEKNENVSFNKNFVGYVQLSEVSDDRWVAKNVPAFVPEPYINNMKNYLTHFDIELSSVHIPGYLYRDFAVNWDNVAKTLMTDESFGGAIRGIHTALNQTAKNIAQQTSDTLTRINLAYEAARKIKWNKKLGIFPETGGIQEANKNKTGSVAEINMSLLILLKKLHIEAYPVLLSTRSNGLLPNFGASINKLNYFIVKVKTGNDFIYLDATDEFLSPGMLPERVYNGKSLVVYDDQSFDLENLSPGFKYKENFIIQLKIEPSGNLKGDFNRIFQEYSAYNQRILHKSFNSVDEYLSNIESQHKGLEINDYNEIGLDTSKNQLTEKMNIILKNHVENKGGQIRINPVFFNRMIENPFKAVTREYPVDFIIPNDHKVLVSIDIPEGYKVVQLPASAKISMPENAMSFTIQSKATIQQIQILYRHNINKPVMYQGEYEFLRSFYDELIKKQSELIILEKI